MQSSLTLHKNNFTFLRLLGAVLVIFTHTYDVTGNSVREPVGYLTNGIIEVSGIGLCIFFFISGYFITQSAIITERTSLFVKKRILRIYPALIVLIMISVFIAGPLLTSLSIRQYFLNNTTWLYLFTATGLRIRMNLPGVFTEFFFVKSFNALLWSIALEIQLYISVIFFLLTGILKNRRIFSIICLSIVISCFLILAFKSNLSFVWMRFLNLASLFYLGSFIYTSAINKKLLIKILLSSILLYFLALKFAPTLFNSIFLLLLITGISVHLTGFTKKINIALKADISYGLYILAFPIQQIVFKLSGFSSSIIVNLLGTTILLVPIAFASWYLIEKPFIALKHPTNQ